MSVVLSGNGGVAAEVDSLTHRAMRTSLRPYEGAGLSGSFRKAQRSGTIGAGLSAASLVYSWKWAPTPNTALALVRRIQVSFGNVTGFAAGFFDVDAFRATTFTTIEATGGAAGTYTGNNGKLRTSHATSLGATSYISTTAAISGGTSTLDTDPFGTCSVSVAATAGAPPSGAVDIFRAAPGEYPMVFANLEGFSIKATAPATGTWNIAVTIDWDELLTGSF
jgi:hypothetical protein